jgi:hypothetical protein
MLFKCVTVAFIIIRLLTEGLYLLIPKKRTFILDGLIQQSCLGVLYLRSLVELRRHLAMAGDFAQETRCYDSFYNRWPSKLLLK